MRIIRVKPLIEFCEHHPKAREPLKSWMKEAKEGQWRTPQYIKNRYRNADILPDNRIVFNIGGNKYRLITKINYHCKIAYIKFIGTHGEYDRINAETVNAY